MTGNSAIISGDVKDNIVIRVSRGLEITEAFYDAINSIATVRLQNHAEIDASGLIIAAARKGEKLLALSEPVSFSITAGAINIKEISINKCNADTIEFFVWDGVNTLRPLCKSKVLPNLD